MTAFLVTEQKNSITFSVRAQPRATKSGLAGEVEGALKIKLAAPPVDGAANEELIRFLAKKFDVSRQHVEIISGTNSKHKIVRLHGISRGEFEAKLNQNE